MIKAENLSYPSTVQVVNKFNYLHMEKIYIDIFNNNLTLTYIFDQSMSNASGLYFTLTLFPH